MSADTSEGAAETSCHRTATLDPNSYVGIPSDDYDEGGDGGDWGERMAREILARAAADSASTGGTRDRSATSHVTTTAGQLGSAGSDFIELGRKDLLFGGSFISSGHERSGNDRAGSIASELEQLDLESFDPLAPELQTSWASYAANILCVNVYPNGITVSHHNPALDVAAEEEGQLQGEHAKLSSSAAGSGALAPHAPRAGGRPKRESPPLFSETGVASRASGSSALCPPPSKYSPAQFNLRFRDTRDYQLPAGRFFLHREGFVAALEGHLSRLHQQGILGQTVVYFGMVTDPFLSLHKKFDVTMGCLALFERYQPRLLVVQTRSPMVISALPTLKLLEDRAVVVLPIESFLEKTVVRYMPGKPRLAERIVAADGLRRQGVKVNLLCGPVLPYGEFSRDAWDFAEILDRHADYITFGSLASGSPEDERLLKTMPIAQKLAADKQFFWLRPYSYREVYKALRAIRPEKLLLPVRPIEGSGQLSLFAA